jgi:hypothetical protein
VDRVLLREICRLIFVMIMFFSIFIEQLFSLKSRYLKILLLKIGFSCFNLLTQQLVNSSGVYLTGRI